MTLAFRNIDFDPSAPVEQWPLEGVLAAVERGGLSDWRRIARAIAADPWGPVARRTEEALAIATPYGVEPLLLGAIERARSDAERGERETVAAEVRELLGRSGLTRGDFAAGIGTSASRLSTYASGKVTPSAALLVRMRRVAGAASDQSPDR